MQSGELQITAVWSFWKIISWNFGWGYLWVQTARVKIIFPLAAHIRGNPRHWRFLANFGALVGDKVHKPITLWVWEIIRCEKREKVLRKVLYQVQNCFPPGVPDIESSSKISQFLRMIWLLERQGKKSFELGRRPYEVPSRASRT